MKSFLFGLGLGVGLGILFAPMSGEETRNNLSERANDLASSARETYEQNRDKVQRGVESIHQHKSLLRMEFFLATTVSQSTIWPFRGEPAHFARLPGIRR